MIIGKDMWPDAMTGDMIEKRIDQKRMVLTYPDLPVNMFASFIRTAERLSSKTAVVDDEGREYTYEDLRNKIEDFSSWLYEEMEIRRGDHVALMMQNRIEFSVAVLSLNRLGAVIVPLPTKYKEAEIHSLADKSDLTAVIAAEEYRNNFLPYINEGMKNCIVPDGEGYGLEGFRTTAVTDFSAIESEISAGDLAILMFTSGTTRQSKGVMIRNYNIMHAIESYHRTLGVDENDKAIIPVPIYLITGLVAIFGLMMHVGGTVYLNRKYRAARVADDIIRYGITFFHASPTVFTLLLGERDRCPDLPSLRMLACGSSNMAPGKIRMLKEWLPDCEFRTIYGLTETTSPGTVFPMDANESEYIGSSGIPVPGMDVKITDDNGAEVPAGTEGTVMLRGSNITESYYRLDNGAIREGWLDTGDIGYVNDEGFLYIVDRKKDMINRGGEKVCSFDIENELSNYEEVADSAVVGIPDDLYGEVPAAIVRLKAGYEITEDELRERMRKTMAKFKIPKHIKFVDEIPLTANMKTDKKEIRRMFQQGGDLK